MAFRRPVVIAVALIALLAIGAGAGVLIFPQDKEAESQWLGPVPSEQKQSAHESGGSVSVAVNSPPEMSDTYIGGDTLRQLVLPSLFIAQPDGSWRASLAEPGSDRTARDGMSAQFRLRPNAQWSNGEAITIEDLRRTADDRFVASIDEPVDPADKGRMTIKFKFKLVDWHWLWSGESAIEAPADEVYGGPYKVQSVTSGFETVVTRNDQWFGNRPFLDQIHLVLISDQAVGRELLAAGRLDVFAPIEDTMRTQQVKGVKGINIARSQKSGVVKALRFSPNLSVSQRQAAMSSVPRDKFVGALLDDEALLLNGILRDDDTWKSENLKSNQRLDKTTIELSLPAQEPLASLLGKSMRTGVTAIGGTLETKIPEAVTVQRALNSGSYQVALESLQTGPVFCWTCHFSDVDALLAQRADGGDEQAMRELEIKLRDQGLWLPMWRADVVVAWKQDAVDGLAANGFATGVAWNAPNWWKV